MIESFREDSAFFIIFYIAQRERLRVHNNRGDCITVGTDISRRYNRSPTVAQLAIRPYSSILGTNVQTLPTAHEVISRLSFYNSNRNKLPNHQSDRSLVDNAVSLQLFLPSTSFISLYSLASLLFISFAISILDTF
jgi:hypothetical protein